MNFKKILLFGVCIGAALQAQDNLTLDPDDIPLTPDPAVQIPVDDSSAHPNLDNAVPSGTPVSPAPPTVTAPTEPPITDTPSPRIEEYKPTPSNLEVRSTPSHSATVDTSEKEERFNRTYTKYHTDSTSSQNWEKVVGKRTSDTYVVNKGDTLWDISGTLFGDPFYWPKIWALNKELIYNPHVIFPEMKIKFYQGSSKSAPTLATDAHAEKAGSEDKVAEHSEADTEASTTEVVPRRARVGAGRRNLPSFFKPQDYKIKKEVDLQVEEFKGAALETQINLEFYISETEMNPLGTIVEVESEFKSAGKDQLVYVKFNSDPNGIYTVLKPGKPVKSTNDEPYNVSMYAVEGEVHVLGKVNSEENIFRTRVVKSNSLVSVGSILVPGRMKTFRLSDLSSETTVNRGRIIGDLNDYGVVGQGNFVVINQGTQSGYQPKMKLPIFEDLARRNPTSLVKQNPQKVGSLVIVDAVQNYSIGYVTHVDNRVVMNDLVAMADTGAELSSSSAHAEGSDSFIEEISGAPSTPADVPAEEPPIEEF